MSDYNLAIRGAVQVLLADGAGPKAFNFSRTIKPASSIIVATVSSVRESVIKQHGSISAGDTDTSPVNAAITAVSALSRAHVASSIREIRSGDARGASVKLSATNEVRLEWLGGALASPEEIVAEFSVIEERLVMPGARLSILSATQGQIAWDGGALLATESIDARYELIDLENLGDDVKEILFRQTRTLSYLGENLLQDKVGVDGAGNPLTYRLRAFDTKANMLDATKEIATGSGLETGEIGRVVVNAKYVAPKGDVLYRTFEVEATGTSPDVN